MRLDGPGRPGRCQPTQDGGGRGQDERREATHDDDGLPEQEEGDERGPDREERRPAHAAASPSPRCRRTSRAVSRHDGGVQVVDRARTRQLHGDVRDHASGPWRHHDDPIGDEDRLGDAVRDQQDRRRGALPEPQQLQVEPLAAQRIERAERLVEEQHLGLEREGAGERDPLTRSRRRARRADCPVTPGSSDDEVLELGQALRAAGGRPAGELERVRDVVGGRAPRQQARLLEHQADARVGLDDRGRVQRHRAPLGCQEPGDHAQQRGLAAAVRPDEGHDPAAGDVEGHAVEDGQATAAADRERQVDPVDADRAAGPGHRAATCVARLHPPGAGAAPIERPHDRRDRRIQARCTR